MHFKRDFVSRRPRSIRVLNKFDSTSPTFTCKDTGFNVTWGTTDIKTRGVDGPKVPSNIALT